MKGGIILIIIGGIFFLKNIGLLEGIEWGVIWPLAIIAVGVQMLTKKRHCATCGIEHGGMCTPKQ